MQFEHNQYLSDLSTFRYATKSFDPQKKISEKEWLVLEESLRLSPSSYGLQPWKFIVVTNQDLKNNLRAASWKQSQVSDCSHLIVFTTLKKVTLPFVDKFLEKTASVRQIDIKSLGGYRDFILRDLIDGPRAKEIQHWAQKQAYLAFANLMTTCAIMHIDSCPLEGIEPKKYDELLGIENTDFQTAAACAIGYRNPTDKYASAKKVRFDRDDVFDFRK
jgi:nitroreductase